MSVISIKMCKKNMEKFSQPVYDLLQKEYPNQPIEVEDCVGQEFCGICSDVPFLLRNNAIIHGRDARDLYYKVLKGMEYLKPEQEQS
ncbi:YuzB family protein [Fodinisporobacter ferrooxydans]|uniref:YuzB family protein n=1 Tax=Fodinisporobacter ferrooxydans TaxID=2901836 RepID=A0ABY4CGY9_9BACL|nr:YuzB family protein [Alicyclobacillaceae bacterium MYW30-H2]